MCGASLNFRKAVMADMPTTKKQNEENKFGEIVGSKETRKLKARRERNKAVWFGLGMFGIVGWSVAIPTLIGIALGIWIDRNWPSQYSWTLMFLVIGVLLGCLNAWYWVKKESRHE